MASDVDPRFDPVFQRGYQPPLAGQPALAEALEASNAVDTRRLLERSSVVEPVETRALSARNPYLIALWIVAALLTVVGVAAQYLSQTLLNRTVYNSAFDYYVVPATVAALAPWFVGAGLFSGVAALVLSAIRWRPELQ